MQNISLPKLSREAKVNIAFGALFVSSMLATGGLSASLVLGSAACNVIGAECTKGALNWLNRRAEGEVKPG